MGRPVNWAPLAESDPVPGEPEAISGEAQRLRDMAVEMRSQISRLRSIGDDDNQGLYADKLRTAASDLAGKLQKTVGRYERVAGSCRRGRRSFRRPRTSRYGRCDGRGLLRRPEPPTR